MIPRATLALLLFAGSTALPGVACADVLQIGESGAEWIAGGPASLIATPSGEPEVMVLDEDGTIEPAAMTHAADAAGPARWRENIARLAAKYDLSPSLLEAVVWQESRWNERAVSPVGARGLAQLMPGTAAQMGVNPHDPAANLEGGARYLRLQLDTFGGDVEKALAAYNAGPSRVARAGGIPAITETRNYVASIMARLSGPVRR